MDECKKKIKIIKLNFNEFEFFARCFGCVDDSEHVVHDFTLVMRLQFWTFLVMDFYMIIHQSIRLFRAFFSSCWCCTFNENYLLTAFCLILKVLTGKFMNIGCMNNFMIKLLFNVCSRIIITECHPFNSIKVDNDEVGFCESVKYETSIFILRILIDIFMVFKLDYCNELKKTFAFTFSLC